MSKHDYSVFKANKDAINVGADMNTDGNLDPVHVQIANTLNDRNLGEALQNVEVVRHGLKTKVLTVRAASKENLGAVRIGKGININNGTIEVDMEYVQEQLAKIYAILDDFEDRLLKLEYISQTGSLSPSDITSVGRVDDLTYVDHGDGRISFVPELENNNYIVMATIKGDLASGVGQYSIVEKTKRGFRVDTTGVDPSEFKLSFLLAVPDETEPTYMGIANFAGVGEETIVSLPVNFPESNYAVFLTVQENHPTYSYEAIGEYYVTQKTPNEFKVINTGIAGGQFGFICIPYNAKYNGYWFPIYTGVTNTNIVYLPDEMENNDYEVILTPLNAAGRAGEWSVVNKTTTSFEILTASGGIFSFEWLVRGQRLVVV